MQANAVATRPLNAAGHCQLVSQRLSRAMHSATKCRILAMLLLGLWAIAARAQGSPAWLRYAIPPDPPRYHGLPHTVTLLGNAAGQPAPEELTAADELDRGLGHMVAGTDVVLHRFDPQIDSIVLGTTDALHRARIGRSLPGWIEKPLPEEGFRIVHLRRGIREWYILQGGSPRAELWAAFRFAALVAEDQQLPEDFTDAPHMPMRAVDLRGTDSLLPLLTGSTPGAGLLRLLASVGINGLIVDEETADVAEAARPYGMRVWLRGSVAPSQLERLATLPNFGGIVLTAGSQGSGGGLPNVSGSANALAQQLRRSGGTVVLENALGAPMEPSGLGRAPLEIRAPERAHALRTFAALEPGVAVAGEVLPQDHPLVGIASPYFGLLAGSSQVGIFNLFDSRLPGLAYAAPVWADALQTPERGTHGDTTLLALLSEQRCGAIGRMTTAQVRATLQQPMLQAGLYAFGRLLWSPTKPVAAITEEWSRQTWGDDARVHAVATRSLLESTTALRDNTAPLGLPLLATATGSPDPRRAALLLFAGEPLAGSNGIGTDRTSDASYYPAAFAAQLADAARCPPRWLLLFHRLPYTHVLPDGKPVIQAIYNAHFTGAAQSENALDLWRSTEGLVDAARFLAVQHFLAHEAVHAEIWRETTTEWLQAASGIQDEFRFVGSHPGRIPPHGMQLSGYALSTADSHEQLLCSTAVCTAKARFADADNVYRVEMGYVDAHGGTAWQLLVNGEVRARWQDSSAPATHMEEVLHGSPVPEAERFVVNGVHLKSNDMVEVRADRGGGSAPLDFIEITRDPRWN